MSENLYSSDDVRTIPFAQNIEELFLRLRTQPAIMGSVVSVSHLAAFIDGFVYCRQSVGTTGDWEYVAELARWIFKRFGSSSTVGWPKIVESKTANEADALLLFWKLYDEFLQNRNG